MAININSINTLQEYLRGVLGRANHHAGNVEGVSLTLLGAVIWRADGQISVRQYRGNTANIIWFFVGTKKYVLMYNHTTQQIELKEKTSKGNILASFDNSSSYQNIITTFEKL